MQREEISQSSGFIYQGSPKIDRMFNTLKFYSPVKLSNEQKMIEQIRRLGQSFIQQDQKIRDKNQVKHRSHSYLHNYSLDSIPLAKQQQKSTKPFIGWEKTLISTEEKIKLKKNQKFNQSEANIKKGNLYDKYAEENKIKAAKTLASKTKEIVKEVKITKNKEYQSTKLQSVNSDIKLGLNYEKYIKNKIQANVEAQQNIKLMKKKQKINVFDGKSHKKHPLNTYGSQFEVQSAFRNIAQKSKQLQARKIAKYLKIQEENRQKQLKQASFKPNLQKTTNYHCNLKKHVESKPKLANFMKRLHQNKSERLSKEKSIILEVISQLPFSPRLNQIQNQMHQSKVKKHWTTQTSPEKRLSATDLLSSRIQMKFSSKKQESYDQKSIDSTLGVSLKNPNELSFLFQ